MFVIVPNDLRDKINDCLDAAYRQCPEAAVDREVHYASLLENFDQTGAVPDPGAISFERKQPAAEQDIQETA